MIRKHALGKFPDLLKASAHSASMMAYLDQNTSNKTAPNQNYAREIMELHTLGVDGGYTQDDVAELSRVLTGWTIDGQGPCSSFNPTIHDKGTKTVLGTDDRGLSRRGAGSTKASRCSTSSSTIRARRSSSRRKCSSGCSIRTRRDAQIATVASVVQGDGRRHQGDDPRRSSTIRGCRRRR